MSSPGVKQGRRKWGAIGWWMAFCLGLSMGWTQLAVARVLPAQESINAMLLYLQPFLDENGDGLRIEQNPDIRDLGVPDGTVSWEFVMPASPMSTGIMVVAMRVLVNGEENTTIPVRVNLTRYQRLPVLLSAVERGEPILPSYIQWQEFKERGLPADAINNKEELENLLANRRIEAKQILRHSWVEKKLVIKRGDKVRAGIERKGLAVSIEAVAMGQGMVGDTVEVRNMDSKRVFMAKIIGPGEVRVEMP